MGSLEDCGRFSGIRRQNSVYGKTLASIEVVEAAPVASVSRIVAKLMRLGLDELR